MSSDIKTINKFAYDVKVGKIQYSNVLKFLNPNNHDYKLDIQSKKNTEILYAWTRWLLKLDWHSDYHKKLSPTEFMVILIKSIKSNFINGKFNFNHFLKDIGSPIVSWKSDVSDVKFIEHINNI